MRRTSSKKLKVALVHKGIWTMDKLSMPLANGYLKAYAMADDDLAHEVDIRLHTFGGGHRIIDMIPETIIDDPPDVLGFSVFGWNFIEFGHMAETYKQIKPDGWVVMGGVHVGHQAPRVFGRYPFVDVVVDGEGEITFANLLKARLRGVSKHDLGGVKGLSFKDPDGKITKTPAQERIKHLDDLPSPFLTGAMPLLDPNGEFLYDAVTMETNRGCPYKCAFCYWGGATGQKIYAFSSARIAAEIDYLGRMKADIIALSDANFGMLRQDIDTLDAFLDARAKYSYPRNLIVCWAKNKGKVFYELVHRMKAAQLHSDFTLALQTLEPEALETSLRKNMKVNRFEDLCDFLNREGMDAYAELIWQLPGETYDSFLRGYDEVARHVSRIATYSNLMIPNTTYDKTREQYKIVTMRSETYDYENIVSHYTMSYEDNVRMHYFLFWARVVAEMMYFRCIFAPLRELAGITQSHVLLDLDAWVQQSDDPIAAGLRECQGEVVRHLDTTRVYQSVRYLHLTPGIHEFFATWWNESIVPQVPEPTRDFFTELLRYEFAMQAIHDNRATRLGLDTVDRDYTYYVRRGVRFNYDFSAIIDACRRHKPPATLARSPRRAHDLYYLSGFRDHIDNHEIVPQYGAKTLDVIRQEEAARKSGRTTDKTHAHVAALPDQSARSLPVIV